MCEQRVGGADPGQLVCGGRVQALVHAGAGLGLPVLGLQLAVALAAVAQALPVPLLLLGLTVITHAEPLGCAPAHRE